MSKPNALQVEIEKLLDEAYTKGWMRSDENVYRESTRWSAPVFAPKGFSTEKRTLAALRKLAIFCYRDAKKIVLNVGVDFNDQMYQCALRDAAKAITLRAKEMKG